jgi:hypothetical protein
MPQSAPINNHSMLRHLNLDFLKLVALVTMTIDHLEKLVLKQQLTWLPEIGRVAFPTYVILLCFAVSINSREPLRYSLRLMIAAFISQPFFYYAFETPYVLNIFYSLGVISAGLTFLKPYLLKSAWTFWFASAGLAILAFIYYRLQPPFLFEYNFSGFFLALCVTTAIIRKSPTYLLIALAPLYFLNSKPESFSWLLIYLPCFLLLGALIGKHFTFIRRFKLSLYAYYPIHLVLLRYFGSI